MRADWREVKIIIEKKVWKTMYQTVSVYVSLSILYLSEFYLVAFWNRLIVRIFEIGLLRRSTILFGSRGGPARSKMEVTTNEDNIHTIRCCFFFFCPIRFCYYLNWTYHEDCQCYIIRRPYKNSNKKKLADLAVYRDVNKYRNVLIF